MNMMTSSEKEKIKYAILLANIAGTSNILVYFWATMDKKEIEEIQQGLYIRAYDVICNLLDGDKDFIALSRYLFKDDKFVDILDNACKELQDKLKNIHEAVLRNIKYADNNVLVPPIAGNFLLSNEERKVKYAKRVLEQRGIRFYDVEKFKKTLEIFKDKYEGK